MTDTLHLEIITAGGAIVDTPAAQVTLPLADGEVGILPRCSVRSCAASCATRLPARSITAP